MIDHFNLDQLRLFHCMDSFSRFLSVYLVPEASVFSATVAFETSWIAHFWPSVAVQGDQAFANEEFLMYLQSNDTTFRPVPSRKHHKNTLQPKHGVIRSIFIRLLNQNPNSNKSILALRAVSISNYVYGSDVMSAFELAKGFSKPLIENSAPEFVSQELVHACDELIA